METGTRVKELGIQLLGGFRITSEGEVLPAVASSRMQALLAYLALNAGSPVSRQRLAFQFWPDSTESQARTNLRQLLHHLRAAWPEAERFLESDAQVLRWRSEIPFSVDAVRFEAEVARADEAERQGDGATLLHALEEAARLYRGDLLPGMYEDWVEDERSRLKRKYTGVLERLISLLEQAGDYPGAIRYSERLLAEDPLREALYQRLMRLHALNGDRAAALHVYHRCETNLRRELDVEPDVATRRLVEEVAALKAPADSPPAAPALASESRLVGRELEWKSVIEAWNSARGGRASFLLVTGDAGIGKTRLVEEVLAHAARQGASTARAACYLADRPMAYGAIGEWLASPAIRPVLDGLGEHILSQLVRVLPGILLDHPSVSPPPPFTETWQRRHFFEALARAVLAAPQPLLLFIDDLQWCDTETIEWLEYLLRFDRTASLLVLGTARAVEIVSDHPAALMLRNLTHAGQGAAITLGALTPEETASLAARICGRDLTPESAGFLYEQTRGNPLFIVEMVRAGVQPGDAPPSRVHAVITSRLERLTEAARELAGVAAAAGRPFTPALAAHASGAGEDRIAAAVDELWQQRIIRAYENASYDFVHGLFRDVAYSDLGPERRRLLHKRIAGALESLHAADLDGVSSQIAEHYERAGLGWEAVPYFERAAAVDQRRYANEEAIIFLERALRLLEQGPAGRERDQLELRLLTSLGQTYIAVRGYASPEVGRAFARARLLCEMDGDSPHRCAVLSGSWIFHVVRAELEASRAIASRYAELGSATGDDTFTAAGKFALGSSLYHLGFIREARQQFAAAAIGDKSFFEFGPELGVFARSYLSHSLFLLGFPDQALLESRQSILRAEALSHPFSLAIALAYDAMLHQFRGDPEAAERQASNAAAVCAKHSFRYYLTWTPIICGWARTRTGPVAEGLAEMQAGYTALLETGARLRGPYYLGLMAEAAIALRRLDDASRLLSEACALSRQTGEHWINSEIARLEGDLLFGYGRASDAAAAYNRALESAKAHGLVVFGLRSAARLCHADQSGSAARSLRASLKLLVGGSDIAEVVEARRLLARAKNAR